MSMHVKLPKNKSVPKTVWMKAGTYRELKRLVEKGLFVNVSEAIRTGALIVILFSRMNPEMLKMFRELTVELRKFNENIEGAGKRGIFHKLWKYNVIEI